MPGFSESNMREPSPIIHRPFSSTRMIVGHTLGEEMPDCKRVTTMERLMTSHNQLLQATRLWPDGVIAAEGMRTKRKGNSKPRLMIIHKPSVPAAVIIKPSEGTVKQRLKRIHKTSVSAGVIPRPTFGEVMP